MSGLDKATKGIGFLTMFLTDIDSFCGRQGDVLSRFPSKGRLDAQKREMRSLDSLRLPAPSRAAMVAWRYLALVTLFLGAVCIA